MSLQVQGCAGRVIRGSLREAGMSLLRPSKEVKPEKAAERGKNRDAWKTNSKSQARGAICLLIEDKQKTNKQKKQQKRTGQKENSLLLELKGNGQFARARETSRNRRETNKQTGNNETDREGEKREIDEPILRCSEGGVRAQGQSTFATRHSFPLRAVRRANVA